METKNNSTILTSEELHKISKYRHKFILDDTIKKKLENSEKNVSFTHVVYKTKKNKNLRKFNTSIPNKTKYISDPYKFKSIPSNIKNIINVLLKENNIGLQTLAYKLKIPLHKLDIYLNSDGLIDNIDLNKILKYFNYTINFNVDDNDEICEEMKYI